MQNIRMRIMKEDDVPAVAALNNAAIPAMTELSEEQVLELFRTSSLSLVATNRDKSIAAFLISLGMGADYASENYQWFEKRGTRHIGNVPRQVAHAALGIQHTGLFLTWQSVA